ncbi:MAG: GlsB/YeaQ/YmgE family stress response membrane protein [bacterium]
MASLIFWILFGGLVGWIANLVVYKKSGGCLGNVIVGIIGSVIGGLVYGYFTRQVIKLSEFNLDIPSLVIAVIGSIILLGIINFARRK